MPKRSGELHLNRGAKRRNTGRRQLRGAVGETEGQDGGNDAVVPEANSSKRVENVNEPEDEEAEPEQGGFTAYNALLTLLGSDKSSGDGEVKKKKKTQKSSKSQEEQSGDKIEGLDEDQAQEEEEEEEEDSENVTISAEDDNEGDTKDPFEYHFANPALDVVAKNPTFKPQKCAYKLLGTRSVLQLPEDRLAGSPEGASRMPSVDSLKLKYRIRAPFLQHNGDSLTDLQKELAFPMFNYQDIIFPGRSHANEEEVTNLYTLHLINHVLKTRDRVVKNNSKLSAHDGDDGDVEYRDQGFTRPKVLVLLPTRNSCYKFINRLISISGLRQTENKKRFKDAFYDDAQPPPTKPEDFRSFFAGNTDDMFCLGIKFTRQAIKLYTSFYSSDVIVASPLGLRMIIGNEGDSKSKRDYDFLSSIEVMLVDQADGILMQSWDNVEHIFKHTNLIPRDPHGCDFSRVRHWYLDQQAQRLRQTIILSQYTSPEMNMCLSKYCHNIGGKLKCRPEIEYGSIATVGMKIRQTFTRLVSEEPREDPNVRFKYFTSTLLPSIMRGSSYHGTLIVVPSYMDFVRLRNYMDRENYSCACISEYTPVSTVSRARTYFASQRTKMLMMTERFHHFRRFQLKGVNQVIIYGLPENPTFYQEFIRFMVRTSLEQDVDPAVLRARIIFSKWDSLKLERIVGTKRAGVLLEGVNDVYEFN